MLHSQNTGRTTHQGICTSCTVVLAWLKYLTSSSFAVTNCPTPPLAPATKTSSFSVCAVCLQLFKLRLYLCQAIPTHMTLHNQPQPVRQVCCGAFAVINSCKKKPTVVYKSLSAGVAIERRVQSVWSRCLRLGASSLDVDGSRLFSGELCGGCCLLKGYETGLACSC